MIKQVWLQTELDNMKSYNQLIISITKFKDKFRQREGCCGFIVTMTKKAIFESVDQVVFSHNKEPNKECAQHMIFVIGHLVIGHFVISTL